MFVQKKLFSDFEKKCVIVGTEFCIQYIHSIHRNMNNFSFFISRSWCPVQYFLSFPYTFVIFLVFIISLSEFQLLPLSLSQFSTSVMQFLPFLFFFYSGFAFHFFSSPIPTKCLNQLSIFVSLICYSILNKVNIPSLSSLSRKSRISFENHMKNLIIYQWIIILLIVLYGFHTISEVQMGEQYSWFLPSILSAAFQWKGNNKMK